MSKNKIFLCFVISFLIWIFLWNILFHTKLIIFSLCVSLVFLGILLFVFKKHLFFVVIFWIWLSISSLYSIYINTQIEDKTAFIKHYINKNISIEWRVNELYKKSENYNSYIVQIHSIDTIDKKDIFFLLQTPPNITLENGEVISMIGKVDKIENFSDSFNYEKFMQSKNVYFTLNKPTITFKNKKDISVFETKILHIRQSLLKKIYEIYPENHATLLAGLLIWAKENLDKEMLTNFNNAGLTHIISVSGFNIAIIIIFLWYLLKFVPVILRAFIITWVVLCFVFVVWDAVAVIRAAIMWLVGYYILILGRKAESLSLLLLTAFGMVVYNPLILNYDISFHLSFLAVLGLLYFQEFFKKIFFFLPKTFAIQESFVLTLSALVTTLPIMIFNFGQVSLLAPISNILVWGMIPFTMLFGFLSILGEYISSQLWYVIGYINFFFLDFIIKVAYFIGHLEFSVLKVDLWMYAIYWEIIYFLLLVFWILYFKQEKKS